MKKSIQPLKKKDHSLWLFPFLYSSQEIVADENGGLFFKIKSRHVVHKPLRPSWSGIVRTLFN